MKILVSACLLGQKCKYNGGDNRNEKVLAFTEGQEVIPVCPEVAGGLPIPRLSCEIVNGVVMNTRGESKDREYREGAEKCLQKAKEAGIDLAVLQSRSPSCGVNQIYDGSFSGKLVQGSGIFASLLRENGFRAVDAEDLDKNFVQFRRYREEDYDAVIDFLITLNESSRAHINWNWARFEWMIGHPMTDCSQLEKMGLWLDGETVVGAALFDMYPGEAFVDTLPGYEMLYPEILAYAFRELQDENGLGVAVCDSLTWEVSEALRQGFSVAEQSETVLRKDMKEELPVTLPAGYSIVEPVPERDMDALQWLFWRGFDHGEDRAEFEREEKVLPRERKHFDPRLALAARDPSGELVSYCSLWYDKRTDYAYVEPVCTVPSHRMKGLAGALLNEAMNRAHAMGAEKAYVISDQAFYGKLGFEYAFHYTFYWKK